jgi:hypothetical protein
MQRQDDADTAQHRSQQNVSAAEVHCLQRGSENTVSLARHV